MLINERHFKQHWLRQSISPSCPHLPPHKAKLFCRVAKTLTSDLEISKFLLLVTLLWMWNGFIGFRGFFWASTLVAESRGCAAALLQVCPSDNLVSLCYQEPARKGGGCACTTQTQSVPLTWCMWLLPNLPLLTIKTQTYSHIFGWNCTNISKQFMHADLYVIREHHTCTWNLWKMLRDLKGNSLGSCLIFLNINPQTVSLNIPHVCSAINTWHFCFSFCLLILGFFSFFFLLFFATLLSCLLHLFAKPRINMQKFPWTEGWCEGAVRGDLGLQICGLLLEWDI